MEQQPQSDLNEDLQLALTLMRSAVGDLIQILESYSSQTNAVQSTLATLSNTNKDMQSLWLLDLISQKQASSIRNSLLTVLRLYAGFLSEDIGPALNGDSTGPENYSVNWQPLGIKYPPVDED